MKPIKIQTALFSSFRNAKARSLGSGPVIGVVLDSGEFLGRLKQDVFKGI